LVTEQVRLVGDQEQEEDKVWVVVAAEEEWAEIVQAQGQADFASARILIVKIEVLIRQVSPVMNKNVLSVAQEWFENNRLYAG
jgi:hypothetical protein